MGRTKVTTGLDLAQGLVEGAAEEEVMGSILGSAVDNLSPEFKKELELSVKEFVSRQAHFGGILEYTAQSAVVDPVHTVVYDWNQTTVAEQISRGVTQVNAAELMPWILDPDRKYARANGPKIKEIIILKSRFDLAPINSGSIGSERIVPHLTTTWWGIAGDAKGKTAIEPDVLVLKYIDGKWHLYIIELKIGAGQADKSKPKEHYQLMRGKRLFMYYQQRLGLYAIDPKNIKLYFCAWMQGTPKKTVDFKVWLGAPESDKTSPWYCKVLQGDKAYSDVVGVKGRFISALLQKMEWVRTRRLVGFGKKFISKTGRYHAQWMNLGRKLTKTIMNEPNAEALGQLPKMIPNALIQTKGHSGKAVHQAGRAAAQGLEAINRKNITLYSKGLLTSKVRNARRKTQVYYNLFKDRYKERLKRAGQPTNLPENFFLKAFITPSPITGSTPVSAINAMRPLNVYQKANRLAAAAQNAHTRRSPGTFMRAKTNLNNFARNVNASGQVKYIKNFVLSQKTKINTLPVYSPKKPPPRKTPKPRTMSANMQTATLLVKSFAQTMGVNMNNAQAQRVVKSKTIGGVNKVSRSLVGSSPPIKNENLANAIRSVMAGVKRKRSPGPPTRASARPRTAVNYRTVVGNNNV